jgi:hypothetical protein
VVAKSELARRLAYVEADVRLEPYPIRVDERDKSGGDLKQDLSDMREPVEFDIGRRIQDALALQR